METGASMNATGRDSGGAEKREGGPLAHLLMVRPGEGRAVGLAALYFFLVLSSYYLLRPVREAMGIARGADDLPWLITGTLVAMAGVNPLFSWLVSRTPRRRFVPLVYRFAGANLVVFFLLFEVVPAGARVWLGYAFYIWLSVFNLFVVSVFWGVLADLFGPERAKRLFGIAAVGGTLGAIVGASATAALSSGFSIGGLTVRAGAGSLMLISAAVLECAVWCVRALMSQFGLGGAEGQLVPAGGREPGRGVLEGLRLVARSPYLQLIALYIFCYTVTSTFLYMEQGRIVKSAFASREAQTAAFAQVDLWTNVLTLAVQVLLTGRVIQWLGLRGTLMVLPVLTGAGFAVLYAEPVFATLAVFQVLRRGMHYAVDRPARETLYAVLNADAKYKSKPFIDTFVYRAGDLIGGWTPLLLGKLAVPVAVVGVPVALAWAAVGMAVGGKSRRQAWEKDGSADQERS
jgi:AAA family ATP:ADP antiporter